MRLLWTRGPATVREIYTWLTVTTPLAYTTIMTTCERLAGKGLLDQRRATDAEKPARPRNAYVYTPRLSEAEFVRQAIGQQIAPVLAEYLTLLQEQITGTPTLSSCGSVIRRGSSMCWSI